MARKTQAQIEFKVVTSEFTSGIKDMNSSLKTMNNELKLNAIQLKGNSDDVDLLKERQNILQRELEASTQKIEHTENALKEAAKILGENSKEYQNLYNALIKAKTQQQAIQNEINTTSQRLDNLRNSANDAESELDDLSDATREGNEGFTILKGTIANICGNVITSAISSIGGLVSSLFELSEATVEINTNQGKLQASLIDTGHSTKYMDEQYTKLYGYLNDDMAVTNTILNMEKLGLSQKKTAALIDSSIAVWTAYGDSIPLEGLAESINETVLVGQVTGTMADAINWAKDMNVDLGNVLANNKNAQIAYNAAIKEGLPVEDAFNEALAKITNEQERANVITEVLNKTYGKSKDAYDEANKSLIEYNRSQGDYQKVQGELGNAMMPINTAITSLKTNFLTGLVPAVEKAGGVIQSFSDALKNGKSVTEIFGNIVGNTKIPEITESVKTIMSSLGNKIKENLPTVVDKGLDILQGLANTVAENAPILVVSGMNLLKNIAQGLAESIPTLIQKVPTLVTTIANTINTCMPIILLKGVEIVWELVKGIVSSIPVLIVNIPKIAKAIFSVWSAINWINLGKNLINGIMNGIKNLSGNLVNTAKGSFNNLKTNVINSFNQIKNSGTNIWSTIKNTISNTVNLLKSNISNVFNGIKSTTTTIWNGVKNAILNPMQTVKNSIKNIINTIKGFFNFKINWPKIPLPHFSIKPSGWKIGDLLKGSIPKLGIAWYAKGGIMTQPTIFGMNGNTLLGGGEMGGKGEAILPLDNFYNYLDDKLDNINNYRDIDYDKLSKIIIEGLKHVKINMDGKEVGRITDKHSGQMISFIERGLIID